MVGRPFFGEDAWEQLSIISRIKGLDWIGTTMRNKEWNYVHRYWKETKNSNEEIERV